MYYTEAMNVMDYTMALAMMIALRWQRALTTDCEGCGVAEVGVSQTKDRRTH